MQRPFAHHPMVIGAVSPFDLHATEMNDARGEIASEPCFGTGLDARGPCPAAEIGISIPRRDAASRIYGDPGLKPAIKRLCPEG